MIRGLTLAAGLFTLGCTGETAPRSGSIGDPAPSYQATTVAGDTVRLEQLRGQVVMLNVWATWCEPCRDEMPALERLHREYGPQGLQVVASSIDLRNADREVREFVSQYGLTFTVLRDPDNRVSRVFLLPGVPNTILIDRKGTVVHRWIGPFDPAGEDALARVREALRG